MSPIDYFKDFTTIPRASGNEREISNYLVEFVALNNLEYYQDEYYNVIIKRKSNNGSNRTIILQGHIDMVCVSINDYDFDNKGIEYKLEDNIMKANGTSLGADNGIGCSIILSILANKELKVPNIEAVFTVSEETTMLGAQKLDYRKLTGKELISIDGTDEGVIEVSSAGMVSMTLSKKMEVESNDSKTYKIEISGLEGGHSGVDIDKHRGNSIKILGTLLSKLNHCNIVSISGGDKDNVIPSTSMCIISTDEDINILKNEVMNINGLEISVEEVDECAKVFSEEDSKQIIEFIHILPIEVLSYYNSYPQTSLNLATINTSNEHIHINISIRSSNKKEEEYYVNKVKELGSNFTFKINNSLPFFEFNENSPLRDKLVDSYKKLYKKDVQLEAVHAGLEGGVFKEHIPDLDICVIAPNLYNIHTVSEYVELDSVQRVYNWLIDVLKDI